jgi:hypothetical protein
MSHLSPPALTRGQYLALLGKRAHYPIALIAVASGVPVDVFIARRVQGLRMKGALL